MTCSPEVLRHVPLFALLDDEEMAVLAGQVELKTFAPRQRIYKIGDPSASAYVMVSGAVRVTTIDEDQQEVLVDEPRLRPRWSGEASGRASRRTRRTLRGTVRRPPLPGAPDRRSRLAPAPTPPHTPARWNRRSCRSAVAARTFSAEPVRPALLFLLHRATRRAEHVSIPQGRMPWNASPCEIWTASGRPEDFTKGGPQTIWQP